MDASDTAAIERWTGPIPASRLTDVEARLTVLGSTTVTALEALMRIYASAIAAGPADNRLDGDATWSWAKNIKPLELQISRCVRACRALSGLNAAAKAVVDDATNAEATAATVTTVALAPAYDRPGEY